MERKVWEYSGDGAARKDVSLAEEEYVTLFVGNLKFARIFASPENLSELGVGFLVTEGVVDYEDIKSVNVKDFNIFIKLKEEKDLGVLTELRSSGCVGMTSEEPEPLKSDKKFKKEVIIASILLLDECSRTWRKTGGTHTACLVSGERKLLASFEDIGRHNALDKVIGWALVNGVSLEDKFVLFTGRISTGVVYKAIRAGLPIIVSNTAGLSKAITIADKLNLTVAGFARGVKFTVYTHPEKII